jgi:hypothetical protein
LINQSNSARPQNARLFGMPAIPVNERDKAGVLALNEQSNSRPGAPARLARRAGRGFVGIPTFKT